MYLDEAVAIYLSLKDRPPGSRSTAEEKAFLIAWGVICEAADKYIRTYQN